jgi:hypothetical protein
MALSSDKYNEPICLAYLFITGAKNMVKNKLKNSIFLLISLPVLGCSTTETSQNSPVMKTHYLLTTGDTEIHQGLLPSETPVLVEWHYSNGDRKKHKGYTGWDFDGDGRFEMVDVLAESSGVETTIFDFDGDGKIDQQLKTHPSEK